MHINANEIHVWSADLETSPYQQNTDFLSQDECERANRFKFPIHRQRFIAARSLLRAIISFYTDVSPAKIIFSYNDDKKPFLQNVPLMFNLSHSDHMVVYAFTMQYAIGVDIEKIQSEYHEGVAERFFSKQENEALHHLPKDKQASFFYQIWAYKEAIIKAIGKGFSLPLSSFPISFINGSARIMIDDVSWSLFPLTIHPDYQSAVVTNQQVSRITYWKFVNTIPCLDKVENVV